MNESQFGLIAVICLVLLVVNTILIAVLLGKKRNKKSAVQPMQTESRTTHIQNAGQDGELIAVLTAAVAAVLGTSESNIRIQSYKRVGPSAWKRAARDEQVFRNL